MALGNTKQPLPAFFAHRCGITSADQHGMLKDNLHLVSGMPDIDISKINPDIMPKGGTVLPTTLRAHMATGSPLQLAARPDMKGLDRVESAQTGAGAIPASMIPRDVENRLLEGVPAPGVGGTAVTGGAGVERSGVGMGGMGGIGGGMGSMRGREEMSGAGMNSGMGGGIATGSYGGAGAGVGGSHAMGGMGGVGGVGGTSGGEWGSAAPSPTGDSRTAATGLDGGSSVERLGRSTNGSGIGTGTAAATGVAGLAPGHGVGGEGMREGELRGAGNYSSMDRAVGEGREVSYGHHHHHHHSHSPSHSHSDLGAEWLANRGIRGASEGVAGYSSRGQEGLETEFRGESEVCGQKCFTEVEDRHVVKERVQRYVEHHPVEKEYVVEMRAVGEVAAAGDGEREVVDRVVRAVQGPPEGSKCPRGMACEM